MSPHVRGLYVVAVVAAAAAAAGVGVVAAFA